MARVPLAPKHPERVCWGCDKYCPVDDLDCGNGTIPALHPAELFGDDWLEWADRRTRTSGPAATSKILGDV
jgi:hypothetical protein